MRILVTLAVVLALLCATPLAGSARILHHAKHAVTCSACGGNGVCWPCHGTGKRPDGANCSICGGSGKCSYCGGRGEH
jgi:hypothetical protein